VEKDANYAVDSPLRQSLGRRSAAFALPAWHREGGAASILPHGGLSSGRWPLSNYAFRASTPAAR